MSSSPITPLRRVLIANRGEIAVRIVRGLRAQGYQSIAVFSDADRDALHVREADHAVHLGPAPAAESYLSIPRLLEAARKSQADAIHPGYGFLSERAAFARAVHEAGLVFVGPDADAIEVMGSKSAAKARMLEVGVPCIPGYHGAQADDARLAEEARTMGFPVMIKAVAGGGGRGMRLVHGAEELEEAIARARSEARGAFGDDTLLVEKALVAARHVEIQIFADRHGNVVHLGERDCSIQRKNQKIVEESPSTAVDPPLRARMGEAAVAAARSVGYVGAGTVEFLLDGDGQFYFLEMNTRLQVEHPVTELVYGVDLVAWQMRVAEGRPLPLSQAELDARRHGHAIEVRLCTEDPDAGFLPQTGRVRGWTAPAGEGVRVDTHLFKGAEISPHYDSMQGKLIAWGEDREAARARLLHALADTCLLGVKSNLAYLARIVQSAEFASGAVTTQFLAQHPQVAPSPSAEQLALAAWVLCLDDARQLRERSGLAADLMGWHSGGAALTELRLAHGGASHDVRVLQRSTERFEVSIGERSWTFDLVHADDESVRYDHDGLRSCLRFARDDQQIWLRAGGLTEVYRDLSYAPPERSVAGSDGVLRASTDGMIVLVAAGVGDRVVKGQKLLVVEAMKMEFELVAPADGEVLAVHVAAGAQVKARQLLMELRVAR